MASTDRDQLLLAEGAALRRLARSLLGPADVDDVVQQTLATALGDPHAGCGHLRPWLRSTLRKLAATLRRADARRARRERLVAVPEAQEAADPARVAEQAELIRAVGEAVHALHEPLRTVVVMRFWRGLLPEAIARELALPRNTVRSQLQRGVGLLRARLDAKFGDRQRWAAPLAALGGVRAAVPAALTGGGTMLFAGMFMKGKLVLGAAAVLLAAAVIPWTMSGERRTPALGADVATPPVAGDAASGTPPTNQRLEVATPLSATASDAAADEGPFDPTPVHVPPWSPDLLVVDEDDAPVAGATIAVFAGTKVERTPEVRKRYGGPRHGYSGHDATPCMQVETDANGRARPLLDLENCSFLARKDGAGRSLEATSSNTRTVEVKLVLVQPLLVRGRVLSADGLPAARAKVTAGPSWSPTNQIPAEPVFTDAGGHFELSLQGRGDWTFHAWLGEQYTRTHASIAAASLPELQLVLPGAFTIAGMVLDAAGKAVGGASVKLWREYHLRDPQQDAEDSESTTVETDASGHFHAAVQRAARYQLLASKEGHASSELVWTETTIALPHVQADLQLQRFAEIRGTVVHEDGSAFAGIKLYAEAESGEAPGYSQVPTRDDRFPRVKPTTSGVDGTFALVVHPGTRWQLIARPSAAPWYVGTTVAGVAPDQGDVVVKMVEDDLGGGTVRCRVVNAVDGKPVEQCSFELQTFDASGRLAWSRGVDAASDGETFAIGPLPCGRRFGLRISTQEPGALSSFGPLAPAEVEPFTTTRAGIDLVVRLQAWVDLPVRVLAADGSVPRDVSVSSSSELMRGVGYPLLHVDAEGRVLLQQRNPGAHRLRLFAGGNRVVLEQAVTILPGPNQEVLLRLPAPIDKSR